MKRIIRALGLLPLLTVACADLRHDAAAPATRPVADPYDAAYEEGQREFDVQIAEGTPAWLRPGDAADAAGELSGFDERTGLPWVRVDGNDRATQGRIDGHNQALERYVRTYGLPPGSREAWRDELTHLANTFVARTRTDKPHALTQDGPAVRTEDGRYAVAWRRTPAAAEPSQLRVITQDKDDVNTTDVPGIPPTRYGGTIDLLWGPEGSDVAYFRWDAPAAPEADRRGYAALDLRTGRWLRREKPPG